MTFYLIVSGKEFGLTKSQEASLQKLGKIHPIIHNGPLKSVPIPRDDNGEKILALDPTSFNWDLDVESIDAIENVKAVITQSTSFDWLKPAELKKRGITACHCPGFSSETVAEYALAMAIEIARRLPVYIKNNWKIDWNQKPMLLKGKTLGIIGMGRIGTAMAKAGSGIGMRVIYWSRSSRNDAYEYVELPKLFNLADVLMPALVENTSTRTLLTQKLIDTLKPSALVVGIGRVRDLLPQEYILEKVAKNELGGYALEGEGTKPITQYSGNVWPLPPMAWISQDSKDNLIALWVENMIAAANGKPQHIIN